MRIAIPNRLQSGCIERDTSQQVWRVWLHTNDWINGTFLALYNDGRVERVTVRGDEDDEVVLIKPSDIEGTKHE